MTSTHYEGPTSVSTLSIAGQSLRIARPEEPDRLLDAVDVMAWNRADDYMPYWAYLWPGAYLLAEAVAREPGLEGRSALEIGCGLGLAGLVGLSRGMSVRFTDYDETPLGFVRKSIEANAFDPLRATTARLDWRELPGETYPMILGADVLYESRLVPMVVGVLSRMLGPDGVGLIAGPYRVAAEAFGPRLSEAGLTFESETLTATDEAGRPLRGTLYRVRRVDSP